MRYPKATLQIFAKAPISGQVKTRLISSLGEQRATELHRLLAQKTITTAVNSELAPVQLWCASDCGHPFFIEQRDRYGLALFEQSGDDLGERMYYALVNGLQSQKGPVVLIGCDCPLISREYLQQALQLLNDGTDVVLGPAEDGGYVLIGVNRVERSLFEGIHWGSDQVFADTVKQVNALGWSCAQLPLVWDVDRIEDVTRLEAGNFLD